MIDLRRTLGAVVFIGLTACSPTDDAQRPTPVEAEPILPTVEILADRAQAPVGERVRLQWTSTDADQCLASGQWSGAKPVAGFESVVVEVAALASYTLTCSSSHGSATATTRITGLLLPSLELTSAHDEVLVGDTVVLRWRTDDAESCEASGADDWQGSRPVQGEQAVRIDQVLMQFALRCTGPGGEVAESVGVVGVPAPLLSFTALAASEEAPAAVQLAWSSIHTDACQAAGDWSGPQAPVGSAVIDVAAPGAYQFVLRCTGLLPSVAVEQVADIHLADPLDEARALFEHRQQLRAAAGLGGS